MAAIVVDNVSRIYQKYSSRHRFLTFKSALLKGDLFKAMKAEEMVTALDAVSFKVEKGTTFGIIGENGSGKSTLLKVVAGITKPTSGSVRTEGKVSALIELGAGFHPEISGRENVYINGIMLGLSKKEINEKFDEIVRFAELEDFIDAPGQDLFFRDVHAAGVLRGHQCQPRHPADRRGPGRGGRLVHPQVSRPDR